MYFRLLCNLCKYRLCMASHRQQKSVGGQTLLSVCGDIQLEYLPRQDKCSIMEELGHQLNSYQRGRLNTRRICHHLCCSCSLVRLHNVQTISQFCICTTEAHACYQLSSGAFNFLAKLVLSLCYADQNEKVTYCLYIAHACGIVHVTVLNALESNSLLWGACSGSPQL